MRPVDVCLYTEWFIMCDREQVVLYETKVAIQLVANVRWPERSWLAVIMFLLVLMLVGFMSFSSLLLVKVQNFALPSERARRFLQFAFVFVLAPEKKTAWVRI